MDVGEEHVQGDGAVPAGAPHGRVGQAVLAGCGQQRGDVIGVYAVPPHLVGQLGGQPLEAPGVLAVEAGQDRRGLRRRRWPFGQVAASVGDVLRRDRQRAPAAATLCTFAQQPVPMVTRVEGGCSCRQDDCNGSWVGAGEHAPPSSSRHVEGGQAVGAVGPLVVDGLSHDGAHSPEGTEANPGGVVSDRRLGQKGELADQVQQPIRRLRLEHAGGAGRDEQDPAVTADRG